jgi:hypothetical protein
MVRLHVARYTWSRVNLSKRRNECEAQVKGHGKARYKKFGTEAEAKAFAFPGRAPNSPTTSTAFTPVMPAEGSNPANANKARLKTSVHVKKPYSRPTPLKAPVTFNAFADASGHPDGWEVVFTDGACKNNQGGPGAKTAGVGVWWGPDDERFVFSPSYFRKPHKYINLSIILPIQKHIRKVARRADKQPCRVTCSYLAKIRCITTDPLVRLLRARLSTRQYPNVRSS